MLLVDALKPRDLFRFAVSLHRWVCVCVDVDAKNRPIGNLSQWDDSLSDLEAVFRSWFIANGGRHELQRSGGSSSRKQVVQLSSRSISAGNLVFCLDKRVVSNRASSRDVGGNVRAWRRLRRSAGLQARHHGLVGGY